VEARSPTTSDKLITSNEPIISDKPITSDKPIASQISPVLSPISAEVPASATHEPVPEKQKHVGSQQSQWSTVGKVLIWLGEDSRYTGLGETYLTIAQALESTKSHL